MDNLVIFCAKYLVFVVPLIVFWVWLKQSKKGRLELVLAIAISGLIALILVKIAGKLYSNPRPFIVEHAQPLVSHGNDNGFPSEHTVFAMTLTAVIYFYHRQLAVIALAITLLVGIGRVVADVHHGVDIVGGLVIGAIAGAAGYYIAKQLAPKLGESPKTETEK